MRSRLHGFREWLDLAYAARFHAQNLARLCGVTSRRLEQYFDEIFRRPPQRWLDEVRLCAARQLLIKGKTVKEVAFELGFSHASHFIREFKRYHGCTPLEFIEIESGRTAERMKDWPEEWKILEQQDKHSFLSERDALALLSGFRERRRQKGARKRRIC